MIGFNCFYKLWWKTLQLHNGTAVALRHTKPLYCTTWSLQQYYQHCQQGLRTRLLLRDSYPLALGMQPLIKIIIITSNNIFIWRNQSIGVYAKVQKATDAVRDTFFIDPAVFLIVVGVVMFFITFCGCIGALRENIRLLRIVSINKFVKRAIVHYRDDLDLHNLMDYIQNEFKCCGWNIYTDWSWNLYFNCTPSNPSTERCAVPFSCCTPLPGETVINTMCGFGVQTQNHLDTTKSIYPVGCADRAVIWIESHLLLVGALTLGLALPQVTFIVSALPNFCNLMFSTSHNSGHWCASRHQIHPRKTAVPKQN
uniref:Tetraspanin-33 n=1 Tax=Sinocyclocheilus rhinocerous TaxID=307959 RepID=A0A673LQF9_9TELE